MALTDTEKQKVLKYLGYPGKVIVEGSTHYHNTVAARLTNLTSDIETNVRACLTALDALETKYTASTGRMLVKKVGDIELNSDNEHSMLSKEHKRQKTLLSSILDIPTRGGSVNIGVVI